MADVVTPLLHRRHRAVAALAMATLTLAACGADDGNTAPAATAPGSTSTSAPPSSTGNEPEAPDPDADDDAQLYVSLGDSYASGFQPDVGANTTNGFAYQVPALATEQGYELELVNFACAGATTDSIRQEVGCRPGALGPGATPYEEVTQADAAEAFMLANPGEVVLVTVSIGGNDIIPCGVAPDAIACVTDAVATIDANLAELLPRLRAAAGLDAVIVGTTYPNVILAGLLSEDPVTRGLAEQSGAAFRSLLNPVLEAAYEAVDGIFVDVTEATGAYGDLTATTTLEPYGDIPVPLAEVCRLTFICDRQDIHPTTEGYALIADLVAAALPER